MVLDVADLSRVLSQESEEQALQLVGDVALQVGETLAHFSTARQTFNTSGGSAREPVPSIGVFLYVTARKPMPLHMAVSIVHASHSFGFYFSNRQQSTDC